MASEVVIDSRYASPGCIFVAIPGESVDGHDFCEAALERGARVRVVSRTAAELETTLGMARGSLHRLINRLSVYHHLAGDE